MVVEKCTTLYAFTFSLFASDGIYKREYVVKGKVEKPRLLFSTNFLNFGFVPKGQKLEKKFKVKSLCKEKVQWQLIEFTYDFNKREFSEVPQAHVSSDQGTFQEYAQTTEITYKIDARVEIPTVESIYFIIKIPGKHALVLIPDVNHFAPQQSCN